MDHGFCSPPPQRLGLLAFSALDCSAGGDSSETKNSENRIFHTLIPDSTKIVRKIPPSVELTESISTVLKSEKWSVPLPPHTNKLKNENKRAHPKSQLKIPSWSILGHLCGHKPFEDASTMSSKTSSGCPAGPTLMATICYEQRAIPWGTQKQG